MEKIVGGRIPAHVFHQNGSMPYTAAPLGEAEWAVDALTLCGGRATFREIKRHFRIAQKHPEKAKRSMQAACDTGKVALYKVQKSRGRPRYEFRLVGKAEIPQEAP